MLGAYVCQLQAAEGRVYPPEDVAVAADRVVLGPVAPPQVYYIQGIVVEGLPVVCLVSLLDLRLKLHSNALDLLLHLTGGHGPVRLPGLEVADLLPGAVPARGDGDLIAGAGLTLDLLYICHILHPFRGPGNTSPALCPR